MTFQSSDNGGKADMYALLSTLSVQGLATFSRTMRNQTKSPLPRLPLKVRNSIYTFVTDAASLMPSEYYWGMFVVVNKGCDLAHVCTQTCNEMPLSSGSQDGQKRNGATWIGVEIGAGALNTFPELSVLELDHTCIEHPSRNTDDHSMVWMDDLGGGVLAKILPNVDRVLVSPGGKLNKAFVRVILEYCFDSREGVQMKL